MCPALYARALSRSVVDGQTGCAATPTVGVMMFLPGSCESCGDVQLVSSVDCIGGRALCSSCGGLVLVVSHCAFSEHSATLFIELCFAIDRSQISPLESAQLALKLADASMGQGEGKALELVALRFPELSSLRPIFRSSPACARQAFAMVAIILGERSKRRESGVSPDAQLRAAGD